MAHRNEHQGSWIGQMLIDGSGHKIGKIEDVYTDDDTGQPEWLTVSTGLMGCITHFVPVRGAKVGGGGVQVPFARDQVKVAPSAGADGRLSRMEKGRLYAHYGYSFAEERNRLQRSLGDLRPDPSPPSDVLPVIRPADLRELSRLADEPDVTPPAIRPDEAERPPPAGRTGGRGRWPDDEAIFGLTQEMAQPPLAASGGPRRR